MKLAAGMESDLQDVAAAVERQTNVLAAPTTTLIRELSRHPPRVVVTCARGSSAHAATFAKHLIELRLGIPVAAAAPEPCVREQRRDPGAPPQEHQVKETRIPGTEQRTDSVDLQRQGELLTRQFQRKQDDLIGPQRSPRLPARTASSQLAAAPRLRSPARLL